MKIKKERAFSLVEVVVAVGIFALAIVGVIGLLGPTTQNISDTRDADSAARVISSIQSALQQESFDVIAGKLGSGYLFFASRGGDKIGLADNGIWGGSDAEKFFEFKLERNTQLSDNTSHPDSSAGYLAFFISLRWPAYLPNGQKVTDDQKNVMIVPAAITR
jgi:type II secretory pathway pseudopilin PulG